MKFMDLSGQRFGRLVVVSLHSRLGKKGGTRWVCRCDCGVEKPVLTHSLRLGMTTSCGCYNKEVLRSHRQDHTGSGFGRWSVLFFVKMLKEQSIWKCRCECGTEKDLAISTLLSGGSKSCGCYAASVARQNHVTHGASYTRTYKIWKGMKQRCFNQNFKHFKNYGGRGITVCERWKDSFENFYADMGDPPAGYTIERKNNDGNYEKDNCKWATMAEQSENKRSQAKEVYLEQDGLKLNLSQWARRTGIKRATIRWRMLNGISSDQILSTIRCDPRHTHNGQALTLAEWAKKTGIPKATINQRLTRGWPLEKALTPGR